MGREERRNRIAREAATIVTKHAANTGKLVEAGWLALKVTGYPNGMTEEQEKQLRSAFFAGAHHLFQSIMVASDPGSDATEADLRRMDLIHHELEAFIIGYKAEHGISDDIYPTPQGTRQ